MSEVDIRVVDVVTRSTIVDVVAVPGGMTTITSSGETTWDELIAATNIGGHRIISVAPDGRATAASVDLPWCRHTIKGISINAVVAGDLVRIVTRGKIQEPSWNWIPGKPIFLSTDGIPTQTPPEMGFIVQVGVAFSPVDVFVFIRPSIVLGG